MGVGGGPWPGRAEADGAVAAGRGVGVVGDEGDGGRAAAGDGAQERGKMATFTGC